MSDTNREADYEYLSEDDTRRRLDKRMWLSWSGRRWLNGREYHGPIFFLGTNVLVIRQARQCPCSICQRTWATADTFLATYGQEQANIRAAHVLEAARG